MSVVWPSCAATLRASIDVVETALRSARDPRLSAFANVLMTDLGAVLWRGSGDVWRWAVPHFEQLLATAGDIRSLTGIGILLTAPALVEWLDENDHAAERWATEGVEVLVPLDNTEAIAHCLANPATDRRATRRPYEARVRYLRGLALGAATATSCRGCVRRPRWRRPARK